MKALIFEHQGKISWQDVPMPTLPEPYGAILQPILLSPCSSDAHTIYNSQPKQKNHILGHECVAQVVSVAIGVKDFKVGDIVAVPAITPDWRALSIQEGNDRHAEAHFAGHQLGRTQPGAFAEYFVINDADTTLAHIPNGVSLEQALMAVDMMTTGFTGAEYAEIKTGDTVCIIGIGPVGLMATAASAHLGAAKIICIGSRPICCKLAKHYGATHLIDYHNCDIVDKVLQLTDGIGPDAVIIAGGNDNVFKQAIDMVRYGIGRISNVNYYGGVGCLEFPKFSGGRGMAGKTIRTELAKGGRVRIERMLKMIQYRHIDPSLLITHRMSGLNSIENALQMMNDKPRDLIKIAVKLRDNV